MSSASSGVVLLGDVLLRRHVRTPGLRLVALAALVLGGPVLFVARFAWSEPLFLMLALAAVCCLEEARHPDRRWLLGAAALVALVCLTRYVGVALVAGGAMSLLVSPGARRRRFATVATFVTVSAVPLAAWMVRNLSVAGTATGGRPPSGDSLTETSRQALAGMGEWVVGGWVPEAAAVSLALGVLLLIAVVLLREGDGALVPLTATMGSLLVATVASASLTAVDVFDGRLLSPFYVAMVVLVFVAMDRTTAARYRAQVAAVAAVWLALVPALQVLSDTTAAVRRGAGGYAHETWTRSELVATLRRRSPDTPLWTNAPAAVWFLLDQRQARISPRRHAYRAPKTSTDDLRQLTDAVEDGPVFLAWFEQRASPYFYTPDEIADLFDVQTLVQTHDGALLAVRARRRS